MNKNDVQGIRRQILTGNLWRIVLALVLPLLASGSLQVSWNFLNGFWVGKLGAVNFAALNISSFFIWAYFAVIDIFKTGTTSLVARYDGAASKANALNAAHQGIRCTLTASAVYSVIILIFASDFFRIMGAEESVVREALRFISIIFIFAPLFSLQDALIAIMKGYGDTKTPMKALAWAFVLMLFLDPVMILGVGPFPQWGIAGGAIATNIGFALSFSILLSVVMKGRHKFTIRRKFYPADFKVIKDIIRIGLPLSVNSLFFSGTAIIVGSMVAKFGTEAMAALGIGHRIESLSFLFCSAFSGACITIVGQNTGAGNSARVVRAAYISIVYAVGFTVVTSFLFYFFSRELALFFIKDPATVAQAVEYLKIISYSQTAMGLSIVLDGVFAGKGKTFVPMLITVPVVLLRIPVAWLLAFKLGMGIDGIWWGITVLTFVKAILYSIWFIYSENKEGLACHDNRESLPLASS